MSEDTQYFNQCLWQHNDKQISNAFLTFEKFCVVDKWGQSPVRLKMSMSTFKSSNNGNYVFLSHQDVCLILTKIKAFEKKLNSILKETNEDTNKQTNITIKLKKNLIITFLNRVEYGGCCVRIILSDKNEGYLDSEKVYIPFNDFIAMVIMLRGYRDSYVASCDNMSTTIMLKRLCDEIHTLNDKTSSYYAEAVSMFKGRSLLLEQQLKMRGGLSIDNQPFTPDEIPVKDITSPVVDEVIEMGAEDDIFGISEPEQESIEEKGDDLPPQEEKKEPENEEDVLDLQGAMDSFIKTEAPNIDLGITNVEKKEVDISAAVVSSKNFTTDVLKNDVLNLEMYVTNLVNDDLPFQKLCDLIKSKLNFNPIEKIKPYEVNSVNYLISHYLKHSLKKCLEEQVDFPANVSPILFSNDKLTDDGLSLMYDLFIYFIYYTQLRNMLKEKDYNPMNNRDFMCFSFKTIASPLAITGFNQVDENTLLNEITNRYKRYRENGVFNKLMAEVKNKYNCHFDLPDDALRTEAARIHKGIKAIYDKLTVQYAFQKYAMLNLKLNYNDFKENSFQDEQIKKIIAIEFNFRKNGKVKYEEIEHKKFDDIPSSIMEKFDIKETKYDNTNLKRYIKELTKDDESLQKAALEIANKINYSYRDLRSVNVDLTIMPVEILRAIFLWDIDRDQKITINYLHYRDVVLNCSLTKDMIISLLTNIQDTIDVDFVNSFIAVRNE